LIRARCSSLDNASQPAASDIVGALRSRQLSQIRRLRDNDCLVVHRGRSHGA
jgi:hypothetical protein